MKQDCKLVKFGFIAFTDAASASAAVAVAAAGKIIVGEFKGK